MAEASSNENNQHSSKLKDDLECAVCLQTCIHPAQLPCGHIFCFLCVKGIANQSKKCAMCRQDIPRDYIDQPRLLQCNPNLEHTKCFDEGYQWFYEGRNGWWQYDERAGKEIEFAYKAGEKCCELLIAGCLYIVDLENMVQLRKNDPSRRRNVKRDSASIPKKGIAGLRANSCRNDQLESSSILNENRVVNPIPVTPSNTPQSPTSGTHSLEEHNSLMERFQALQIDTTTLLHNRRSIPEDQDVDGDCTNRTESE